MDARGGRADILTLKKSLRPASAMTRLEFVGNGSLRTGREAIEQGLLVVGRHTYGATSLSMHYWGEPAHARIGAFCSIGEGCTIFLGGNHRTDWITMFPFGVVSQWATDEVPQGHPATKGDVEIGSDVWLGAGVTIMSGVRIGHGAAIAATSTVTKDVPPYAIVGGNPARLIRHRFGPREVQELLEIAWWEWDDERIRGAIPQLCCGDVHGFLAAHRGRLGEQAAA
jgi:chloramphenicol O-acetyltransferase type B